MQYNMDKYIELRDNLDEYDFKNVAKDNLEVAISDYEEGDYDGHGIMIAKCRENGTEKLWLRYELGHCSCYGPLEQAYSGKFTFEEIKTIVKAEFKDNDVLRTNLLLFINQNK